MPRAALMTALCIVFSGLTALPVVAQDDGKARDVTLTTPSRVSLAATYWPSPKGKESAVIVMLHEEGGNRKKWAAIAGGLQKADYAVLSVDLRKHGESAEASDDTDAKSKSSKGINLRPADYQAMCVDDMEAVKKFLMEKHHKAELNVRKTGIVAIGAISGVAINAAALDWQRKPYPDGPPSARTPKGQDVQTLVLISPESNVKGLNLANALKALREVPLKSLVFVGNKDKDKKKAADKVLRQLQAGAKKAEAKERAMLYQFNVKLNGELMVAKDNRKFLALLTEFHDTRLDTVDQPWRDRRSKLDR